MASGHSLPHEVVCKVPRGVNHSVVSLDVCIEALVVEHTVNSAIESVDTRVVLFKLRASQALPEVYFAWLACYCGGVASKHPGMRAFLVGSHTDKGIKAEAKKEVAQ